MKILIKPSLVICHNSMHSKKQTFKVNPLLTNLYPAFYNYSARFPENHPSKILERQLHNKQLDAKYHFLKDKDSYNHHFTTKYTSK